MEPVFFPLVFFMYGHAVSETVEDSQFIMSVCLSVFVTVIVS